jgi:hypothetical protein
MNLSSFQRMENLMPVSSFRSINRRSLLKNSAAFAGAALPLQAAMSIQANAAIAVRFGRLTRIGEGGYPVPAGSTVAGNLVNFFTVTNGFLVPTASLTAVTSPISGQVGGVQYNVTLDANTYSCAAGQLQGIINAVSNSLSGKTIMGRPGVDIGGTAVGSTVTFPVSLSLSSGLTITSESNTNRSFIRRAVFRQNGLVRFTQISFRDSYLPADTFGASRLLRTAPPATTNGNERSRLEFDNCSFSCVDPATINVTPIASATNAAHTNGVQSSVVRLTNSPNLSAVSGNRLYSIRISTTNYIITAVDNVAKTVTITGTPTIAANAAANYVICHTPQILGGFAQDGFTSPWLPPDVSIANCNFFNLEKAFTGTYRSLEVINSTFDSNYADHISMAATGNETKLDIIRNKFYRAAGVGSDPLNPHVDDVQVNLGTLVTDNAVPYRVIGNEHWHGGGRANDPQGIFFENIVAPRRVYAIIEHNVIHTAAGNGIVLERGSSNSLIQGNTLLYDLSGGGAVPYIDTKGSPTGGPVDQGVTVAHNLCPYVITTAATYEIQPNSCPSTSACLTNNYLIGRYPPSNENVDYAGFLQGTNFSSNSYASLAAFRTATTPDPGIVTLNPPGNPKIGARQGYYDYATGVDTAPY